MKEGEEHEEWPTRRGLGGGPLLRPGDPRGGGLAGPGVGGDDLVEGRLGDGGMGPHHGLDAGGDPVEAEDAVNECLHSYFISSVEDRRQRPTPSFAEARSQLEQEMLREGVPDVVTKALAGVSVREYSLNGKEVTADHGN